jgi:hypothetical protein
MEDGQLPFIGNDLPHGVDYHFIRYQGSRGHLRTVYGRRGHIWSNARHHCESTIQVRSTLISPKVAWNTDISPHQRAYPTAGMFAVCKPDVPCITPGTYAFLGAAAALGYVYLTLNFKVFARL